VPMRLSRQVQYAICGAFDLAYNGRGGPVQIRLISERQAIPSRPRGDSSTMSWLKADGMVGMILSPFKKNGHPVRGTRYSSVLLTAPMIYLSVIPAQAGQKHVVR